MKKAIIFLIGLMLINYVNVNSKDLAAENKTSTEDSLMVISTPDLYNLSVKWVSEYNKLNPGAKFGVINISDIKKAEGLIQKGNIGFISNESTSAFENESIWKGVIGRDIIVPIINSNNPFIKELSQQGISAATLKGFLNSKDAKNWGTLLKNSEKSQAHYFWINDESISKGLNGFLNSEFNGSVGIEVENEETMVSAIQKDPLAIGFCKMINIINLENKSLADNIKLLPIDRNGNGIIDYNEKIYDDVNNFSRGVWIGKYPKSLYSNIYSVTSTKTMNQTETAFMKWVLTDGQKFLAASGYSELLVSERQTTFDKLLEAKVYAVSSVNEKPILSTFIIIIVSLILAGFIFDGAVTLLKHKKSIVQAASVIPQFLPDENSLIIPAGIYYDKTHTWAFMEQNGVVKVGIDDFMQHITGAITRIKMKSPGEKVKKGEAILSIVQNGKQLNLYSPITGIIKDHNKALDSDSSVINSSPYTDGWVYKIEPTNWLRENQLLFMAEKQKQYVKSEFLRLKDFIATALSTDINQYSQVILQDGGELRDGVLSNLGPEEWENFQTKFIDPSRQIWFYELF
jgi:glycine cleavage system H lipoate-binding protein/ABC-type phosphate transport system substrate-binding protein